jgi:hypothetical protein
VSETLFPIDDLTDDNGRRMQLRPCPFCGHDMEAPISLTSNHAVRVTRLQPRMDGRPAAIVSVRIQHWCPGTLMSVTCTGRDHWEAEERWNRRAG